MSIAAKLRSVRITSLRHEDHIPLNVPSGFVVFAMGNLPGEVRDQQCGVANPSHGIVQSLRWRERLVSTFVGQDPQTGTKTSLYKCVCRPENSADGGGRHVLRSQESVEEVEREGERSNISDDITQATDGRALEAVSGNGVSDFFDCEVRDLEFIAVGVEHFSIAFIESYVRVEGG